MYSQEAEEIAKTTIKNTKKETVNHPKHYNAGKLEVIDVIEDWNLNFNLGNAVKYIGRAEHKGKKTEDINKAIWYLKRELEREVKTNES